jgi:hypothetical protein
MSIRFSNDRIYLSCYFPMPYFQSARIELKGSSEPVNDIHWTVGTVPLKRPPNELSYFHATYRDFPHPSHGRDLVLLDTQGLEQTSKWSGQFVGTSFIFSHEANLTTLEGDPRFFFDDRRSPPGQGTGTEDWGGGGDYWRGLNMTQAFVGHPVGAKSLETAKNEEDRIESAYRFLLGDLMPFGKNATITLEHGGENESVEHYETVTYWYGLPSPSLIKTDELRIGNSLSELVHDYRSPEASPPYAISSRYEWGPDSLNGQAVYPEEGDVGRTTRGTSEFHLGLRPDNQGVLLRRKLDYSFPNQRGSICSR